MDKLTPEKRSWNMSRIKGKDTKPEVKVRKYLFSKGYRFRKNDKRYPGKPDIVLPKYKTVIFINGCFWHMHPGCKQSRLPKTNTDFWLNKLNKNVENDNRNYEKLRKSGLKVIILWECNLDKNFDSAMEELVKDLSS